MSYTVYYKKPREYPSSGFRHCSKRLATAADAVAFYDQANWVGDAPPRIEKHIELTYSELLDEQWKEIG